MNKLKLKALFIILLLVNISGCSGLSNQLKVTREGIKIDYSVKKETIKTPLFPITISAVDERRDKEILGSGARASVGKDVLGYISFGVLYAFAPKEPTIQNVSEVQNLFPKAFHERFLSNGVKVLDNTKEEHYDLDIKVRNLRLDFHLGKWLGEVSYIATLHNKNNLICEQVIDEKVKKFNTFGFGSGQKAFSNAFNNAINKFDLNKCLSALE